MNRKNITEVSAFTLAEVLISLAIIGVVAAITLPSLISETRTRVKANQMKVIEKKIVDGLNLYNNLDNSISGQTYNTSYEFLEGLSKHYKINKICGLNNLSDCIPYKSIDDDGINVKVKDLKTNENLGLTQKYIDAAGFISADGIPFLFAVKRDCNYDPDLAMKRITDSGCFAVLYDINGNRRPNKIGEDIISYGGIYPKGYFKEINGVKVAEPAFFPQPLTEAQCLSEKQKNYGVLFCGYEQDYWAGAMKHCHDEGWRMPSSSENQKIAAYYYVMADGSYATLTNTGWKELRVDALISHGFKNSDQSEITKQNLDVLLWNGGQGSWSAAGAQGMSRSYWRNYNVLNRNDARPQALCILNEQ